MDDLSGAPIGPGPALGPGGKTRKNEKGCFFYGCLSLILIFALALGCIGYAGYALHGITADEPDRLPLFQATDKDFRKLEERIRKYQNAEPGKGELELDGEDLNTFVSRSKLVSEVRGKIYLTVERDEIRARLSIPLDAFPGFGGRYANGTATLKIFLDEGYLVILIKDFQVNGEPVPDFFLQKLRTPNWGESVMDDPSLSKIFTDIDSITVENGKIIIKK